MATPPSVEAHAILDGEGGESNGGAVVAAVKPTSVAARTIVAVHEEEAAGKDHCDERLSKTGAKKFDLEEKATKPSANVARDPVTPATRKELRRRMESQAQLVRWMGSRGELP